MTMYKVSIKDLTGKNIAVGYRESTSDRGEFLEEFLTYLASGATHVVFMDIDNLDSPNADKMIPVSLINNNIFTVEA